MKVQFLSRAMQVLGQRPNSLPPFKIKGKEDLTSFAEKKNYSRSPLYKTF